MDNSVSNVGNDYFHYDDQAIMLNTKAHNYMNLSEDDELIEVGNNFDFNEFQVVRREFFAHSREASISFNDYKISFNAACVNKFPNADFVQLLVNREKRILALRPCHEDDKDSFAWTYNKLGKRKPKIITCKLFFAKMASLMDWNPNYRYKILGKPMHSNNEFLMVFDLNATETYRKKAVDGGKLKGSRTPVYPAEWQNQFGLPFNEHEHAMQVNIFDGYAVYSINNKEVSKIGESALK